MSNAEQPVTGVLGFSTRGTAILKTHTEANKILQCCRLGCLYRRPEGSDLLLNARVHLLHLQLLLTVLFAHATLLEVEVQAHARLRD